MSPNRSNAFSQKFMPMFAVALALAVLGCDVGLSAAAANAPHAQLQLQREAFGP